MEPYTADILKFLAFGIVWLFPIAIIIAVLGFSHADAKSRQDDLGPNVVQFPERTRDPVLKQPSLVERIKRLASSSRSR